MPYVKRTTKAGKTIEVEYYYTARYNRRGQKRAKKVKATPEQQKKINARNAERKLRLLINANFGEGDYHLILNYVHRKGDPWRTAEEMKEDIRKFKIECRKEYRKAGLEFKYIHVMEIGKRGSRHHHLIVNHIDPQILQRAWNKVHKSRISVFPLDDTGQYGDLANYLVKYTGEHLQDEDRLMGKRWSASRNLKKPEQEVEIVSSRAWFRCEPRAPKGWYVDKKSVEKGIHSPEYFGYGFFRYTMVKLC